ncbi:E3 ubiquitin-protein ligase TRIM39-like [Polypterus senegalus]|uniref:E3 ubiquitin-protein ligase TRIM39-like n=1 Tax=Polypterus senegalus TaxID=55291 RepID=UPI00196579E2|nr:E3 ubiquitin-protein ligase TRIM39-like [Polypterus senegalus]
MDSKKRRSSPRVHGPDLSPSPSTSEEHIVPVKKKKGHKGHDKVAENVGHAAPAIVCAQQLTCPVCLDIFTSPISTPCGHSFCMECITRYWGRSGDCICPFCKKIFRQRPDLNINRTLAEITEEFKQTRVMYSDLCFAAPGDVSCDVCSRRKFKAVKSCLVCLASFCNEHIRPHIEAVIFKKHTLVEPVSCLEDTLCTQHSRPLELFCMTDQTYICLLCGVKEHKIHNTVHIEVEWVERMKQRKVQKEIQEKHKSLEELKTKVESIKKSAYEETEESTKSLDELMQIIEKKREDVVRLIEMKETTKVNQTEHLIKQLEQDIQRLEGLLKPNDYFNCLVKEQSVCEPSNSQDPDPVTSSVDSDLLLGIYRKAFGELSDVLRVKLEKTTEADMARMQKYAVNLTLDPHTASPSLTLSADGKEVCYGDAEQELPDNPLRFDIFFSVLSKEGFTSGRHYWEVKVGEKTDWILGVVRESINRKGDIELCPQNGYWTVSLCYGSGYWAFTSPSTFLALNVKPRKVGVFLDYEEGQLSFFNVESQTHLYTFIDTFTEKLYPYFSPCANEDGKNAVPLIICTTCTRK